MPLASISTSHAAKEEALKVPHVEVSGLTIFLGVCENRLVVVKIYKAPCELPDTAVIGHFTNYGQVMSFRRDKITGHIESRVQSAKMILECPIPSFASVAGEPIRVCYPNQPKTCRNCSSEDHVVKECSSVCCFNCDTPGHHSRKCPESPK